MESYQKLLRHILRNGESHEDRTGVGTTSVFGYTWRHHMPDGFPLLTTKKVPLRWVFEELMWFLRGETKEQKLQEVGVDIWQEWSTEEQCAKFGRKEGDLGPIYGSLWRKFPVGYSIDDVPDEQRPRITDQIAGLLDGIVNNPNSRRLIVSGWHPYYATRVSLPPCHTMFQVKCHDTTGISLHLYARSIDAFLGLPFNIASYGLLLEILAKYSERVARDLVISFGDLHIYNNHVDQVNEQLSRKPRQLPTIEIAREHPVSRIHHAMLSQILRLQWKDITLHGYDPYPKISAEVAV